MSEWAVDPKFAKLSKQAGAIKKYVASCRTIYRGLVFFECDETTKCYAEIRKWMLKLMPLVARLSVLFVEGCPEMWKGRDAEVVDLLRSFYGISDDALFTFDLVYIS